MTKSRRGGAWSVIFRRASGRPTNLLSIYWRLARDSTTCPWVVIFLTLDNLLASILHFNGCLHLEAAILLYDINHLKYCHLLLYLNRHNCELCSLYFEATQNRSDDLTRGLLLLRRSGLLDRNWDSPSSGWGSKGGGTYFTICCEGLDYSLAWQKKRSMLDGFQCLKKLINSKFLQKN